MIVKVLKGLGLLVGLAGFGFIVFYLWATAGTYPPENYAETTVYNDEARPETDSLTLVSYNIGYLSGLANAAYVTTEEDSTDIETGQAFFDRNLDVAIATLRALNPDFIAFQEIDIDAKRSYHVQQVETLANALQFLTSATVINWDKRYVPFPYWPPANHFGKVVSGQAILSQYPIQTNQRIVLEKVASNPFYYNAVYLDRLAQVTQIDVNGQPLILINLHLEAFDAPTRINQTQVVKDLAEQYAQDYPVLLVGDFNSAINRDEEGDIKSIEMINQSPALTSAIPVDQWADSAQGTYPSNQPAFKLDYIFYTPDTIELIDAHVVTEAQQTSDHLPVAITFRWRR